MPQKLRCHLGISTAECLDLLASGSFGCRDSGRFSKVPSWETLQPEIPERCFIVSEAFKLNGQDAMVNKHGWMIVDQNRHQLAVDEKHHGPAAGNHVQLVPIADFPH